MPKNVCMDLMCVRHGRTAWNADLRFQGHVDIPLDHEGRAQAAALATLVRDERIDIAVSSDLARAAETARIVLGRHDVELRLDEQWREMRFGAWEGLRWDEIVTQHPELAAVDRVAIRQYNPVGGERFDALCARVARATDRVTASMTGNDVALVATHAGPLHALLHNLLGEDEAQALNVRFLTASITRFRRSGSSWQLVDLNLTGRGDDTLKAAESSARNSAT